MKLRDFINVAKPGIVFGNVFAAVGGFFIGSPESVNWSALTGLAVGTLMIIAGSCVINNYLDRDIDVRMSRTRKRPSVRGVIPVKIAMIYAGSLLALGLLMLLWLTNAPTALIGFGGALLYTLLYGYTKRHTPYATFIGAFPGATPPLAGYIAATGRFDLGALLVFSAMFAWQMPHFYAISLRRLEDYKAAGVPVMPAVKGLARTVWEMRFYGVAFIVLCFAISHYGYAGFMFGCGTILAGLYWLAAMFSPYWRTDTTAVAKKVFLRSLAVLFVFCSLMVLSHVLL